MVKGVVLALLATSASSLAPQHSARHELAQPKSLGRRGVASILAGGLAGGLSTATAVNAYEGVYSMEIVKAGDAVLDTDALNSGAVKRALDDFKGYAVGIVKIKAALEQDSQFDVVRIVRSNYDFVKVRATFNAMTPIWDEETQRGVDRVMRGILQDLVELEAAAKFNDEGKRTPKKLALTTEKLQKTDGDFRKLFAYLIGEDKK